MTVYVSLLRAVNVGGTKKIKMADLRALYDGIDLQNVTSILQSGNVVFSTPTDDLAELRERIENVIAESYDFSTTVLVYTATQWREIVDNHPFTADELQDPKKLLLMFLQDPPADEAINTLNTDNPGREIIRHHGRVLYIVYPDGMGRSKLDNKFIERRLNTIVTGRNWNTVNKLLVATEKITE